MSALFSFPGQGAQCVGMLHALAPERVVVDTLAEAGEVLGRPALALDGADALGSSAAVQLALLIAGVATARSLVDRAGPPDAVAGLSIGAYPAAVIAGVLRFDDALRLVELRARLMEAAFPSGHGMTAILGLDVSALEPLIARVHGPGSPVYLANINAPTQLVVAGSNEAMARVAALAQARGANGIRRVAIAVPSHCPLLAAPAAELAKAAATVSFAKPRMTLLSASHGRVLREPARIADDLVDNMARPVLWHDTSTLAHELGVRLSIEMPPGQVLTKLGRAAFPEGLYLAASETRADSLALLMQRERAAP